MTYNRVDLRKYCVISIWFGCNSNCSICMLSRNRQNLPIPGFDTFRQVTAHVARENRYEGIILSGGEVTTFRELENYVRFAAGLGRFKKIQIQTNGRRLSDRGYVERLIEWGVNEFFLSVHGLGAVHDVITGVSGAFGEVEAALANLAAFDVNVISNSVLTKINYDNFSSLIAYLARTNVSEMQVWNYFPMERTDSRDYVVGLREFQRLLSGIVPLVREADKPIVFKSFPHCLPIDPPAVFDGAFPATALPDLFWKEFDECGFGRCVYRESKECEERLCWGLSSAYIRKYGTERDLLRPLGGRVQGVGSRRTE